MHQFALRYLENGFNASEAYRVAHPGVTEKTSASEGYRTLRNPKVSEFLKDRLEEAWKPYQMGGEQALGRVAVLARASPDDKVKLAALKVILEQSGKLKTVAGGIDALAEAIRADQAKYAGGTT